MDEISKLFEKYCEAMRGNKKGAQIGVYSVALTGLIIAMRRVRPFSRFVRPSDVPNLFIKKRRLLTGRVERIEPNGALLMVRHKPPVDLKIGSKSENLPVKVSGVDITGHGISWLQAVVAGNDIQFIPVLKQSNCVHCEVVLPQLNKKKKITNLDVGESLISVGFGKLQPEASEIKNIMYVAKLRAAEDRALRKQLGIKYYIKPTKLIAASIVKQLTGLFDRIKPIKNVKTPKVTVT